MKDVLFGIKMYILDFMRKYKKAICFAIGWWYLTTLLQIDRIFFVYENLPREGFYVKFFYLLFLIFGFVGIVFFRNKIKEENPFYCRMWYVFKVIFGIYLIFLLVLWPGTWNWDDIWVLSGDRGYGLNAWQHILSSYYHMLMLQVFPTPGGIIFMSCLMAAICVAYVVTKTEVCFLDKYGLRHNLWWTLVKIIPFILPPVIMYLYSGYRIGIYVILEAVLLTMMLTIPADKEHWSMAKVSIFVFLTAILATWRTEAFLYVPLGVLVLFLLKDRTSLKRILIFSLAIVMMFAVIHMKQQKSLGNSNYEIISMLRVITPVIHKADKAEYCKELENLTGVIDLDFVYENPKMSGDGLYWTYKVVKKGYTKEQYKQFVRASLKLIMEYPGIAWDERWKTFVNASCIKGKSAGRNDVTRCLFDKQPGNRAHVWYQKQNFWGGKAVFNKLRTKLINRLCFIGKNNSKHNDILFAIFWNMVIPWVGTIIVLLWTLSKKKWCSFVVLLVLFGKFVIVFLTEPTSWIMYHLSTYLSGYLLILYGGIWLYLRCKNKVMIGEK